MTAANVACKPPAPPWKRVERRPGTGSYVSVFLSSDIARLPVRDITKLDDNKSDPNLETGTYGLFSTCEPIMRDSIRRRGISEIFFVTTVTGLGRCLVGWYELGWMVEVGDKDVALAASRMRFVTPIAVNKLRGRAGANLNKRLRNFQIISDEVASDLRELLDAERDRTADYLDEIARLERRSLRGTGFKYPSWDRTESFSWDDAALYLGGLPEMERAGNTSRTEKWVCTACGTRIRNRARLKLCSACRALGTLEPAVDA